MSDHKYKDIKAKYELSLRFFTEKGFKIKDAEDMVKELLPDLIDTQVRPKRKCKYCEKTGIIHLHHTIPTEIICDSIACYAKELKITEDQCREVFDKNKKEENIW